MYHQLECLACRSLKTTRVLACASLALSVMLVLLSMSNTGPQVAAHPEKPVAVAVARHGAARVEIGNNPFNGDPGIYLYDKDNHLVGELSVDEDGGMPSLMFRRPGGVATAWLTQHPGKDPTAWMVFGGPGDSDGTLATIGVRKDKDPKQVAGMLVLRSADGTTVFEK